jgi:hypothetical protein
MRSRFLTFLLLSISSFSLTHAQDMSWHFGLGFGLGISKQELGIEKSNAENGIREEIVHYSNAQGLKLNLGFDWFWPKQIGIRQQLQASYGLKNSLKSSTSVPSNETDFTVQANSLGYKALFLTKLREEDRKVYFLAGIGPVLNLWASQSNTLELADQFYGFTQELSSKSTNQAILDLGIASVLEIHFPSENGSDFFLALELNSLNVRWDKSEITQYQQRDFNPDGILIGQINLQDLSPEQVFTSYVQSLGPEDFEPGESTRLTATSPSKQHLSIYRTCNPLAQSEPPS